jgi:hypothetical protein
MTLQKKKWTVKVQGEISGEFMIIRGLRQGDVFIS